MQLAILQIDLARPLEIPTIFEGSNQSVDAAASEKNAESRPQNERAGDQVCCDPDHRQSKPHEKLHGSRVVGVGRRREQAEIEHGGDHETEPQRHEIAALRKGRHREESHHRHGH